MPMPLSHIASSPLGKAPPSGRSTRKAISKTTRFEVFKRDGFKCQYCGAHPPAVVLQVDHIIAVAAGGASHIDNYVTACQPCNLGKGVRDLKVAPQSLSEKAKAVSEREAQLAGYHAIMEAARDRAEEDLWRVAEIIDPGSSTSGMRYDWTGSIRRFNEKLGVHDALDAADKARAKHTYGGRRTFLYFCGICWMRIRGEGKGA